MKKRSCRTGKTIIGEAEAKLKDEAYAKSLSLKSAHPKSIKVSLISRKLLKTEWRFSSNYICC
jgi:hypothetical protein